MVASFRAKSIPLHRLTRFVSKEAIALILNIKPEQIYRIERWRYVVHVCAKGISRFISYADFPPLVGVQAPSRLDFWYWQRRLRTKKERQAPAFWADFYADKLQQAISIPELSNWGSLLATLKYLLPETVLQTLQSLCTYEKYALENL